MSKIRLKDYSNLVDEALKLKELLKSKSKVTLDWNNESEKLFVNKMVHRLKMDDPHIHIQFNDNSVTVHSERIIVRFDLANSIRDEEYVVYITFLQGGMEVMDQITMSIHGYQAEGLLRIKKMVDEGTTFNDFNVSLTDLQTTGTSAIFTFFSYGEERKYGITAEIVQNRSFQNIQPGIHFRNHNFITIHDKTLIVGFEINDNLVNNNFLQ